VFATCPVYELGGVSVQLDGATILDEPHAPRLFVDLSRRTLGSPEGMPR
jgi:hypothetical protein